MTSSTNAGAIERSAGFTLIEMMVVLAIIMCLTALAYPSYRAYAVKARRVEAQAALLKTMQDQERYYTLHNTYLPFSASSTGDDERRFRWWLGNSALASAYELSARACGDLPLQACVELRAEPGTSRVNSDFRDPQCETLSLKSTGQTSAGGVVQGCWP